MGAEDNKSIVQEFYDQWNAGAIDFERLVDPKVTNHQPGRNPETGLDNFRQAIERVMGAVPDSVWTTLRLVADEDFVVCHNSGGALTQETTSEACRPRRASRSRSSMSTSIA
jgi:predicted ester cyclase